MNENLGHPPENMFIPRNLRSLKIKKANEQKPDKPIKIRGNNNNESVVWFKQDDQFD